MPRRSTTTTAHPELHRHLGRAWSGRCQPPDRRSSGLVRSGSALTRLELCTARSGTWAAGHCSTAEPSCRARCRAEARLLVRELGPPRHRGGGSSGALCWSRACILSKTASPSSTASPGLFATTPTAWSTASSFRAPAGSELHGGEADGERWRASTCPRRGASTCGRARLRRCGDDGFAALPARPAPRVRRVPDLGDVRDAHLAPVGSIESRGSRGRGGEPTHRARLPSSAPVAMQHVDRLAHLERVSDRAPERLVHAVRRKRHRAPPAPSASMSLGELCASGSVCMKAPSPTLTSSTIASAPAASFFDMIDRRDERDVVDRRRHVAQRVEHLVGGREVGRLPDDGAARLARPARRTRRRRASTRKPGIASSLSSVPPVWPRPRPLIFANGTPHAATSGASASVTLSPTPPVECLSTTRRPSAPRGRSSRRFDHRVGQRDDLRVESPWKSTAMQNAAQLVGPEPLRARTATRARDLRAGKLLPVALRSISSAGRITDRRGHGVRIGWPGLRATGLPSATRSRSRRRRRTAVVVWPAALRPATYATSSACSREWSVEGVVGSQPWSEQSTSRSSAAQRLEQVGQAPVELLQAAVKVDGVVAVAAQRCPSRRGSRRSRPSSSSCESFSVCWRSPRCSTRRIRFVDVAAREDVADLADTVHGVAPAARMSDRWFGRGGSSE